VDIDLNGDLEGFLIGTFLASETDIPFLYITGRDDPAILDHARKTFPNLLLMKPFDCHTLEAAIGRALQNKRLISTPVQQQFRWFCAGLHEA
jgi:DNA-binding NarL/FixJ family response regulator